MKPIKCNLKNVTEQDKLDFKASEAMLLISIGREEHEGEMFEVTAELMNKTFSSVVVAVYDSIQRFTLALDKVIAPESFRAPAAEAGRCWIQSSCDALKKMCNLSKVVQWEEWLCHPLYEKTAVELEQHIRSDACYRETFYKAIKKYLDKYELRDIDWSFYNRERAEDLCYKYIFEECVVFAVWVKLGYQYEVYPGVHNDAINATRDLYKLETGNYLRALTFRFRNAKRPGPQKIVVKNCKHLYLDPSINTHSRNCGAESWESAPHEV